LVRGQGAGRDRPRAGRPASREKAGARQSLTRWGSGRQGWREIRRPGAPDRGCAPRTAGSPWDMGDRGPQKHGRDMGCMGGEDPSALPAGPPGPRLRLTDTTFRDGNQSLLGGHLRGDEIVPVAAKLDAVGLFSLEAFGGATFETSLRLGDDPWETL